jgi:glycosyltransferase involved in cell wall biosynthesis
MRSMLDLVAELRRRRPVEFVVVSPEATAFEEELAALEVIRLSATPDEMVDLVASCHVGLSVCRDDAGVSLKAAMPTKIGEFLASGRPVVVNPGLVDIAELVQSHGCGVVFGSSGPCSVKEAVDLIEERLADPTTPGRCRGLAEEHFDLERGVARLLDTYRSVHTRT